MGPQLQQILTATVDKVDGSTSICAGVENRRSVCVNPSQYSVCMNGVPTSNPTSCDDGTTCVNGFCVALDHPSANVCYSALDNNIACTSERSYVSCLNQDIISSPIKCPQGTKCCGNACRDESSPACGALPSQPPQPSTTPIPSTPQLDCRKIKDNNIICRSADNFNYCLSNSLTSTLLDTSCPFGTYCCGETNSCQPSCQVTLPSRCAAVPDGSQLCVSDTEFNLCSGGAFALARPQKCSPGTECCADSNVCNFKAACGKQLPKSLLPYSQVQASVSFGTPINVCAQVPESQMACLNPTFYTTCQNGFPSNIIAQCPAGKKCCNNACLSPENAQCNVCAVAVDYGVACTSEDSFTICLDNRKS
ncbi:hypothetical protein BDR26DRAFT_864511 [Obelidium mucronatum]|nr:hypothetical protein BDR26DRAFT_864511 [Obelidium mucronatum]